MKKNKSPDGFGTSEKVVRWFLPLYILIGIGGIAALTFLGHSFALIALIATVTIIVGLGHSIFKLALVLSTMINSGRIPTFPEEIAEIDENKLPMLTILAPHFQEDLALMGQIECFENLDWPKDKLEVLLLIRENDLQTIQALVKIKLPSNIRVVWIGPENYGGKPRSLMAALKKARGEIITIMDSESRPERDQLKKVWLAFCKTAGTNVAAVQARTLIHNASTNLLTRHFGAEYTFHHKFIVPALAKHGLYVPLPGNSVYFKGEVLKELSLDVFSLTEDAELGVRFCMSGYRTVSIDSTTWEEAPTREAPWIRQRSRWQQGFGQTWLKFMRKPILALRLMKVKNFLTFQMMIGVTTVIPVINPFFWGLTIAYAATGSSHIEDLYPPVLFYMGLVSMITGNFIMFVLAQVGCLEGRDDGHVKWMFTIPYYWLLQTIAAWRATYRLMRNITGWDVTPKNVRTENSPPATHIAMPELGSSQRGEFSQSQP